MFDTHRLTATARTSVVIVVLFSITGCASSLLNLSGSNAIGEKFASLIGKDKDELADEEDNDFETRVKTPLMGDYMSVTGNNLIPLRGIGLVTGLNGTGGDPPPSHLRKALIDEMARRKIPNPSRWLASRNTALVMVTAYLPPMVRKGQNFDVRVTLPPNSEATSLVGGTLLETRLSEEQSIQGRGNVKGHTYGMAHGAILTALGANGATKVSAAMLRRGSIPGGAVSNTERDLRVILRNEYRGLKTSKRIENAISSRLHHFNRFGQRISMAKAKTDLMLELKVHPLYRNNFPRYQQMIRSIAFRETDVARRLRIEALSEDLLDPSKAERTALKLEAIGAEGIPVLKRGLISDDLEVRFHAAQALAYQEDSSGVEVLKAAAIDEPAFRAYAMAALSVVTDADGIVALRELLREKTLETRYGAVRALKDNSPNDPALGTVEVPHQFIMHVIESEKHPAVHVVRYRAPEIVVFGRQQEIRLPAVLNAGSRIRIMGNAGQKTLTITQYNLNEDPKRMETSTNLVEVIETLAKLGASYPDVVQMLLEAETQSNLMGELGIDRLPQAGRVFARSTGPNGAGGNKKKVKLGTPSLTPGLFDRVEDSDHDSAEDESTALDRMFAMGAEANESSEEVESQTEEAVEAEDEVSTDSAESIDEMDFSELEDDLGADDSVVEETEFQEKASSKFRRLLTAPFQKRE